MSWRLVPAGALAIVAVFALALVMERIGAAIWMVYKFHATSPEDGYISLSADTARFGLSWLGLLLIASLLGTATSARSTWARRWFLFAANGFLVAMLAYVALGFSPWNRWHT